MLARSAFLFLVLASGAQAAAFDDLKANLSACLRFELNTAKSLREVPAQGKAGFAVERCEEEVARLDRADGRRVRGDWGLSPSSRSVIESVLGRGDRTRNVGMRY